MIALDSSVQKVVFFSSLSLAELFGLALLAPALRALNLPVTWVVIGQEKFAESTEQKHALLGAAKTIAGDLGLNARCLLALIDRRTDFYDFDLAGGALSVFEAKLVFDDEVNASVVQTLGKEPGAGRAFYIVFRGLALLKKALHNTDVSQASLLVSAGINSRQQLVVSEADAPLWFRSASAGSLEADGEQRAYISPTERTAIDTISRLFRGSRNSFWAKFQSAIAGRQGEVGEKSLADGAAALLLDLQYAAAVAFATTRQPGFREYADYFAELDLGPPNFTLVEHLGTRDALFEAVADYLAE